MAVVAKLKGNGDLVLNGGIIAGGSITSNSFEVWTKGNLVINENAPEHVLDRLWINKFSKKVQYSDGTNWITVGGGDIKFLRKCEEFIATEGQTLFTLVKGSYAVGTEALVVHLWGSVQPNSAYEETSSTSFTLKAGVPLGTCVYISYIEIISIDPINSHGATHITGGGDSIPLATGVSDGLMSSSMFNSMNTVISDVTSIKNVSGYDKNYFVQDTQPTPISDGDRWFSSSTGIEKVWDGSAWRGINTYS